MPTRATLAPGYLSVKRGGAAKRTSLTVRPRMPQRPMPDADTLVKPDSSPGLVPREFTTAGVTQTRDFWIERVEVNQT